MILGAIFRPLKPAGPLLLRLAVGAIFLYHGAHKVGLLGDVGFREAIQGAVGAAHAAGFSADFWGYVLAFTELGGGACLVLGLFTRYAALALGFAMGVAVVKVHWAHGFDARTGGFEFAALLLFSCAALLLQGGGWLSADGWLVRKKAPPLD